MTDYRAVILDAATGAEGHYDFSGSAFLISASPMRVAQGFFDSEVAKERILPLFPEHEINAALKHGEPWVVTLMGTLISAKGNRVPFMMMISLKD